MRPDRSSALGPYRIWRRFSPFALTPLAMLGFGCGDDASKPAVFRDSPEWRFVHSVIDSDPLASYRINEVQIGDIDSDGRPDVWVSGRGAGAGAHQMAWYRNPDWTRYEIAPGDFKYGNLGDVDGDGDLDVVVGQSWFENIGMPEAGDWPRHWLGHDQEPDLVHLGDLNGDDRLDIVFTTKRELYWLPSPANPRQTWPLLRIAEASSSRTGGALADIDRDGDLDILWGNGWLENPGEGDHTDWPEHTVDGSWPTEARGAVGDLDGDGRPDIVLSGEESRRGVAWYSLDGASGSWIQHPLVASGYEGVHSLSLADFDADGDLDLFLAEMHHGEDPDKVSILENLDSRGTEWAEHVLGTRGSHNAKVGDLDLDGYPDIVGKNYEAGATPLRVDLWRNRIGEFLRIDRWSRHFIDEERPWQAVFVDAGDVDGDGRTDVVTGGWWYRNPGRLDSRWRRHRIGDELRNMAVLHDLDGDGDLDVLGTRGKVESPEFLWAENDGAANFTLHRNLPRGDGDFLQGARVADIIPGGNPEIVLSWHNATSTQMLRIPAIASRPWIWEVLSPATTGEQIAVGDIDRDGDLDLHLGTAWLRNDSDRWQHLAAFELGDADADPDRVELADLDRDGDLDEVIGCEHQPRLVWGEAPPDPSASWKEHLIASDILAMSLDVADLDGDGDLDVVAGEHDRGQADTGRVIIYQNVGDARSWHRHVVDSGLEHHDGTRFTDIDGDADLDLVSIGWNHGKTVLYENRAIDRKDPMLGSAGEEAH